MNNTLYAKQPDITRQKLLEAAFHEVHLYGFQAASLGQILGRAQVTKGALYHHFADKKSLGLAIIDELVAPYIRENFIIPLQTTPHPLQTLLELIQRKSRMSTDEMVKLGCPLNNLLQEMSPVDEDFRARLNAVLEEWRVGIATALQRAQAAGEMRNDVDATHIALFVVAALEGCVGIAKNLQSLAALQQCRALLVQFLATLATEKVRHAASLG
ncbi:MAG: hypothetical protein RI964_1876 [Pseudomonadota bacterium]|jgi:AcrR family transcriptional regulator